MSIYIKDMDMPIGHNEATFGIDADGYPLVMVYSEKDTEPEIYNVCLVPPHGRLIDADALYHEFKKLVNQDNWYYNTLSHAPTIIPADQEASL